MDSTADTPPIAGPSRPRQSAQNQSVQTPKARRRSWFPFGGSTSTPADPAPPLPPSKGRAGTGTGDDDEEEHELGPVTPRQSTDMRRSTASNPTRPAHDEELLTIDGQVEQDLGERSQSTVKKKKKKRRSKGPLDEDEEMHGEAMRMTDFKPPRRTSTASDASSQTEMPSGDQQTFTQRTFSRTASDRLHYPHIAASGFVQPPPRVSSIPIHPPAKVARIPSDTSNKEQPPIPVDRPLPPLPPDQATTPPAGIVVTPSSPLKDRHRHSAATEQDSHSLGTAGNDMRSGRRSRSRGSSKEGTREPSGRSVRTSPIGLGLPNHLPPSDERPPPPGPSKKQSVSTPVPLPTTRTPSPIPKIAFIEPQEVLENRGRTETVTDKRQKVKRARSLSGIFKSNPAGAAVASITPTNSRPSSPRPQPATTPEVRGRGEGDLNAPEGDDAGTGGGGGLLEWLGVKKTVKRRQSETHLRRKPEQTPTQPDLPRMPSPAPRISHDSRSGKSPHGSFVDLVSRASQDSSSRPPSRNAGGPASTSALSASPASVSRLGSLFTRRQSSKRTDTSGGPSPPMALPTAGPGNFNSGPPSSRSSFSLPPFDPAVSPIYPNTGPWMSSPATETEEMLFSPEGGSNWGPGIRPWMDGTEQPHPSARSARTSISSPPLGSLPERGVLEAQKESAAKPPGLEGRGRSQSDAPPPTAVRIQDPRPAQQDSPGTSPGPRLASSLHASPVAASRPKLGNRANSGNVAIIDRMKTVFARSSSRQRASTLLPEQTFNVPVDEFGSFARDTQDEWPSNASSASFSSPPAAISRGSIDDSATGSLLGLQDAERRKLFSDNSSNRSSIAASITSQATSTSARLPPSHDMRTEGSFISRARPRASTLSSGPTHQSFTPPSPAIFPAAATPPRRRPSAIRKLSHTLLGTSSRPSSPKSGSLFPLPPRSSGSTSSVLTASGPLPGDDHATLGPSASMSPRPSIGSIVAATTSATTPNFKQLSARDGEETPEHYVERISQLIRRDEIAGALATSNEPFFAQALKYYMERFNFTRQPLDVALRQLLMQLSLPKETQQIDRVMEAFAARYEECEPDLFRQKDNTYVLAFSMIMLHTDAFNKHNKNKMSKADYVRNTRLDGVSSAVLEAFYDNITFTPFVYIEDDADLQPSSALDMGSPSSGISTPGSMPPPKSSKIDVYHMIVNRNLAGLKVDVERYVPSRNPFSCSGALPQLDLDTLHQTFTKAQLLQVTLPGRRKTSTGILSSTPTRGAPPVEVTLKVVKVGLLSRMDDSHDAGKKTNRKWKSWSVILTGSQLLFFKDSLWAMTLQERARRSSAGEDGALQLPPSFTFKPDEVFPLKDCVAVNDRSATRSLASFRFVMPQGRQYLFSAPDQKEMDCWVGLINYAAAFKSAGVKMRGISMNKDQAVLAGAAAAASHKRDVQGHATVSSDVQSAGPGLKTGTTASERRPVTPKKAVFGSDAHSRPMSSHSRSSVKISPVTPKSDTLKVDLAKSQASTTAIDVDAADDVVVDEGEQLEKVFDVVKAELAAGRGGAVPKAINFQRPISESSDSSLPVPSISVSTAQTANARSTTLLAQLERYVSKRDALDAQLVVSLTTARNLAILTPFQRTTRDRIASAVPPLADRIQADRTQWAKYDCWISILQQDLDMDKQEWATVRHVALQAAAKSLKDPKGVKAVVDDVNADNGPPVLPRLSLPEDSTGSSSSYSPISPLDGMGGFVAGSSPGELPIVIRRSSENDSPPHHHHHHHHDHNHHQAQPLHERERGSGSKHREREKTVRPSTASAPSTHHHHQHQHQHHPRPRFQRSSSSLLSVDDRAAETETETSPPRASAAQTETETGTTTGRSTPLMFNLSESEDNGGPARTSRPSAAKSGPGQGDGGDGDQDRDMNIDKAEEWQKTRAAKRVSLASVDLPDGEMKKLSLRRRDREVTAIHVGTGNDPDQKDER